MSINSQSEPLCGSTEAKSHVQSARSMTLQVGQLCPLSPLILSTRSQDRKLSQKNGFGSSKRMGGLFVRTRLAEGHLIALVYFKSKGRKFDDINFAANLL